MNKYEERVKKYISELDLENMECGKYPLDGEDKLNLTIIETKELSDNLFELHDNFYDCFLVVSGEEVVLLSDKCDELAKPYNPEKDVAFYNCSKYQSKILKKGEYVIIDTETYHKSGICVEIPMQIKKAIFKLKK